MGSNAARAETLVHALHVAIEGAPGPVTELFTDDVKAWTPGAGASSRADLIANIERRGDAFSDMDLVVTPLDVGGDYASAEWSVSMTHIGALTFRDGAVVEPTGLRITVHGVTVAEFDGDRICALRQYWDELGAFEQLGLLRTDE